LVVFLIIASLVVVVYLLKFFAEYMIGIGDNVRKRRMKSRVDKLSNHYIICGLGRVGHQVAKEMRNEGVSYVALDRDPAVVEDALKHGYIALVADSTEEGALHIAGVERAAGLVSCLGGDSHNLFVTVTARAANPDLFIVARVDHGDNESKLKSAGADRVAHPYKIGGFHMANMALRSNIIDYMDIIADPSGREDLRVEEMEVKPGSKLAGHNLGKILLEGSVGATVIAIRGADGRSITRPTGREVIYPGDRLIVIGSPRDLTEASAQIS
jgi:voltage-gated potassium channel